MNGFKNLTKIQKNAIPVILENRNTLIKSETGSGKTLTYLVPLIEHLSYHSLNVEKIHRDTSGTMAIIFAPTRELAVQIDIELRKLLKLFYYMVTNTLMGGESPKKEKERLRKGCVILICTPGRLLYHLKNTQAFKLDKLQYLIFDEADRILDMGFEKEMNECLDIIKSKSKHNFITDTVDEESGGQKNYWSNTIKVNLVSATMSPSIDRLGAKLMRDDYAKVGFSEEHEVAKNLSPEQQEKAAIAEMIRSIPR